ncbi:radical SAM protein [Delftia sp. RIT313]|uniref:radical SAM protein n=1 Tax=Delftia sp. RIT313 TaxID=1468410 RepID=UPI00044D59C2|nr:radical SAM protein [Delftia sp. RIT313]EZP53148.1 pyrroloquinoline quinone biosynthesis protein PqqE [Delftia sp. RIT313]
MNRIQPQLKNLGLFRVKKEDLYIELALRIKKAPVNRYDFSKLYFSTGILGRYSEERAICFRLQNVHQVERIRVLIPDEAREAGWVKLRLEAFVQGHGEFDVVSAALVPEDGDELSRQAYLLGLKEWVRAQVVNSESRQLAQVPHLPESLSLELTAACNLHCSHCSSHGVENEHRMNNRRPAFSQDVLESLAHEVFPYLTLINLVGRGEPSMVSMPLWNRLFELCEAYNVLVTCVTNGTFVKQRFDERKIRLVDTLTFSIDGITDEVFAANRTGADLPTFKKNLDYYQTLRRGSDLLRRPRLGLSWTLKRNNIHEFPDFIRFAIESEADLLYVRHLLLFRPEDAEQSLVGEPELCNHYLSIGYAMLEGQQIKLDVPPLAVAA